MLAFSWIEDPIVPPNLMKRKNIFIINQRNIIWRYSIFGDFTCSKNWFEVYCTGVLHRSVCENSKCFLCINYFCKMLHLRCFTEFGICLCILYCPSPSLQAVILKRFQKIPNMFETAPNFDSLSRLPSTKATYIDGEPFWDLYLFEIIFLFKY